MVETKKPPNFLSNHVGWFFTFMKSLQFQFQFQFQKIDWNYLIPVAHLNGTKNTVLDLVPVWFSSLNQNQQFIAA
jgi:hypothetical protein